MSKHKLSRNPMQQQKYRTSVIVALNSTMYCVIVWNHRIVPIFKKINKKDKKKIAIVNLYSFKLYKVFISQILNRENKYIDMICTTKLSSADRFLFFFSSKIILNKEKKEKKLNMSLCYSDIGEIGVFDFQSFVCSKC